MNNPRFTVNSSLLLRSCKSFSIIYASKVTPPSLRVKTSFENFPCIARTQHVCSLSCQICADFLLCNTDQHHLYLKPEEPHHQQKNTPRSPAYWHSWFISGGISSSPCTEQCQPISLASALWLGSCTGWKGLRCAAALPQSILNIGVLKKVAFPLNLGLSVGVKCSNRVALSFRNSELF